MNDFNNDFENNNSSADYNIAEEAKKSGFAENDAPNTNYYTYTEHSVQAESSPPISNPAAISKARTAMILGIIAISLTVCCCNCFPPVTIVLAIISLVMAIKSKKLSGENKFSGMALAAVLCSIFAIVFTVSMLVYYALSIIPLLFDPEFKEIMNEALTQYGYEAQF